MLTEASIIARIAMHFPPVEDVGIGDDASFLPSEAHFVSTDLSVEGTHFDGSTMTLADAAYRTTTANISDIAAMGGELVALTLALGAVPEKLDLETVDAICLGIKDSLADNGCSGVTRLIGGDLVKSPVWVMAMTVLGCMRPNQEPFRRGGAQSGHRLMVIGDPGMSLAGYLCLRRGMETSTSCAAVQRAILAHRRPVSSYPLITELQRLGAVKAAMDLSDGLALDLPKLVAASACGAYVETQKLEPSEDLLVLAELLSVDPIALMVGGGEDYGLLIAVEEAHVEGVLAFGEHSGYNIHIVGTCVRDVGVVWDEPHYASSYGFEHFQPIPTS